MKIIIAGKDYHIFCDGMGNHFIQDEEIRRTKWLSICECIENVINGGF